jgi:hypothetical protein
MQSRFMKICLSLIVLLLLVVACRPALQPNPTQVARPVEYKIVDWRGSCGGGPSWNKTACEQFLNALGKEGWHYQVSLFTDAQVFTR